MQPIRVLYLDHTAKLGGAEITLVRLLRPIDRTKVTPLVLLAEDGPLVRMLDDANVQVRVLPLSEEIREVRKDSLGASALARPKQLLRIVSHAQKIARFARRNHIDIIHTNSLKAHIYGSLAGKLAGIPVVWHVRDFIDESYLPNAAVKIVRQIADKMPTKIVAVSQSVLCQLQLKNVDKAEVLYDGLGSEELAIFDAKNAQSSTRSAPTPCAPTPCAPPRATKRIGMIGRIGRWKGQHLFLEAAAKVLKNGHHARFSIVGAPLFGEDDYLCELHAQVEKLGLGDQVEFTGFVDDVPEQLRQMDIVVHASISAEPFGMVIVEGMAAGKPVIASNGGGVPEIVVDGESGLLFPMGDADALAQRIELLLNDSQRAYCIGEAASRRVRQHFTAQRAARQIEEIYARMLSR